VLNAQEFTAGHKRRDVRILARTITLAENDPRAAYALLAETGMPPGDSHVIGITGPPGVGKSSLVNAMAAELRAREETVAVLAIDPSSPFKGGALLGDRIRMNAHAGDPGVYIRSMATRGVLGGLSRAAWIGVRVLATWGFDWIVVETAGVGQSEIDVIDLADTTILVLSPGLGDDVQVMKAGIMEVADIFVVNKADLLGSDRVRNSLVSVLGMSQGPDGAHLEPEVYVTTANAARSSSSVPELTQGLVARVNSLASAGRLPALQRRRARVEIRRAALALFGEMVDEVLAGEIPDDAAGTDSGTDAGPHIDPLSEAERILAQLVRDPSPPVAGQPNEEEQWC
jgi:GTPase